MSKVIEAKAVISAEDRGLGKLFDKLGKQAANFGKGFKVSADVDRMAKSLERLTAQGKAVDSLRGRMEAFAATRQRFREAQAGVEAAAKALAAADKPTKALETNLRRARAEVEAAARAFEREKEAVLGAKRALADFGGATTASVKGQARLAEEARKTATAMERQIALEQRHAAVAEQLQKRQVARQLDRRTALSGATATAGVVMAHRGKTIGLEAINAAGSMDYAVRYQHVATDVSEAIQRSLLLPQAKRIGQETKFTNEDIVHAQTATMQSLPIRDNDLKAEVGAALVDQVRNYAVIMTAGMTESAEGLRSFLQTTNKDISTKEKAVAEATRGTNLLVKMGKLGGMSNDDVQAFIKYGFPTGTQAGLSDTTLGALGSVGRRSGLRGDEIGVFARSAASKLVAPTRDGREALTVAGIDYDRFTKMPGGLSAENLEKFQAGRFGKGLNDSQRSRLVDILENRDLTNREDFIKEVQPVLEESFGKTKKGKTKAQDSAKIAKMIGDFWKLSMESVDAEGLLDAILSNPKMTPALRNAFFTDKHGGKAGILASHMDQFRDDRAALQGVVNEPTFSSDKAKYMTQGLGGALDNLKGGWETLVLNIGQANEGLIRFAADGLAKGTDMFSALSTTSQQILTLVGGAGAAGGGVYGAMKFINTVFGAGGGAAALTASATALDASAAALTAAAVKLGGGAVAGSVAGAAGTAGGAAAGAATRATVGGAVRTLGVAGLVGALGWEALKGADYLSPSARPGYHTSPFGNAVPGRGWSTGGRSSLVMPPSWGGGGLDVSGGIGATSGSYVSNRPKTWYETFFGGQASFRGGRDTTRIQLPSFGGGDKQMPSEVRLSPDSRLEATVKPDQITAKIDALPPVTGTADVNVTNQVNVAVTLNEPMLQAKIDASAGRAAAKMSLSSSGARPGAVSMPGAAATPGASP